MTELTLRFNVDLVRRAKAYAARIGKPLAQTSRIAVSFAVVTLVGCAGQFPVEPGQVMRITPAQPPLGAQDPAEYHTTLQVKWFGAGSHQVQLGDLSVLIDPFVSHQGLLRSGLGWDTLPDSERVRRSFGQIPEPQGILVAHSHWDHMLDLHELLRQRSWWKVPIFGSLTTRNILLGYPEGPEGPLDIREVQLGAPWRVVSSTGKGRIEYMAWESRHAPHALGITLYGGKQEQPRTKPPTKAHHFPAGTVYSLALRLANEHASFTVFYTSTASRWPEGLPPLSPSGGSPGDDLRAPDVAVLCAPGWNKADGYPERFVRHLEASHIVVSHFDDFFQLRGSRPRVVPTADLDGFLHAVQTAVSYPGWKQTVVPDVGTVLRFRK